MYPAKSPMLFAQCPVRYGRSITAAQAKSNDSFNRCRRALADHVEHECRCGGHEAFGNACVGRNGFEPLTCADRYAGDLLLDSRTKVEKRTGENMKNYYRKFIGVGFVVSFTPRKTGEVGFACGMNMMRGKIIVR